MHDPMTVAFEIRSPFKRKSQWWPQGYRNTLITIWHKDPECHGDDDSCGWSYVTLSEADRAWAAKFAGEEWRNWFGADYACINLAHLGEMETLSAAWLEARMRATQRSRHKPLSAWDVGQILRLLTSSCDNFGHVIADARKSVEGME